MTDGETPRAWAATILATSVLAVLRVVGLIAAVYEYGKWRTPQPRGISADYSPDAYLTMMLLAGVLGLLALGGSYVTGLGWWRRRRGERENGSAPEYRTPMKGRS